MNEDDIRAFRTVPAAAPARLSGLRIGGPFLTALVLAAAAGVGLALGFAAGAYDGGWSVFVDDGWIGPAFHAGPADAVLVAIAAVVAVVVAVPLAVALALLAAAVAIGAAVVAVAVVTLVATLPLWLVGLAVWAVVRASGPRAAAARPVSST